MHTSGSKYTTLWTCVQPLTRALPAVRPHRAPQVTVVFLDNTWPQAHLKPVLFISTTQ